MQRFGFITDTHYDYRYGSRRDDALASLIDKTRQCYKWFRENGCDFVIHGGDMFDRHRIYNFDLIRSVRSALMESGLKTYFIIGQHDLHGYNLGTLKDSNLGFLSDITDCLELVEDEKDTGDYCIVASHVNMDSVERVRSVGAHGKPVICLCHALLTEKREAFGTISITHVKNPNVQLVLSGDLHDGVPMTLCNGIQFYNPGALARTERGTRMPRVGMLEWDGDRFSLQEFLPSCAPCEDVFFWDDAQTSVAETEKPDEKTAVGLHHDDAFVEMFRKFHSETKDVHDLILKIARERGLEPSVIELIEMHRDRGSAQTV